MLEKGYKMSVAKRNRILGLAIALCCGCGVELEDPKDCSDFTYTRSDLTGYTGVDVLIVVDDLGGMTDEQIRL